MYGSECSPSVPDVISKRIPSIFSLSSIDLLLKKEPEKKKSFASNSSPLVSSSAQEGLLLDIQYAQAPQFISQIEDPLWKQVCGELIKIMGPLSVLKIWESHLGAFSASEQEIEIQCKSEDIAQFVQQYAFVILGSLQHYFSTIKSLKVKVL